MRLLKKVILIGAITFPLSVCASNSNNEALQNLTDQYLSNHAISDADIFAGAHDKWHSHID